MDMAWMRTISVLAWGVTAVRMYAAAPEEMSRLQVECRGSLALPDTIEDAGGSAIPLTGLSGVTWLGADRYAAVMDNSRFVLRFRLVLAADGAGRSISDLELVTLAARHDYEDIACRTGAAADVYLCEEDTPAIRFFRLTDGVERGSLPLPAAFRNRRPNRGPEAIALDPDGRHLWTANEEALATDGPAAAARHGTVVRLVRLPIVAGRPTSQIAYEVDPPHEFVRLAGGTPLSGVVALVALGQGRLLVLERSAGPGLPPFTSRLFLVDATAAADVSSIERGLSEHREALVPKTLLWSDSLGLNLEGLCRGPPLGADRQALVGISDNGGLGTPTQVTTFEVTAVTSP